MARAPEVDHLHPETETFYGSVVDLHRFQSGSDTDPAPAFYLNADPDTGSQTNADQTLESPKVEVLH